jgi:hypothetical protein
VRSSVPSRAGSAPQQPLPRPSGRADQGRGPAPKGTRESARPDYHLLEEATSEGARAGRLHLRRMRPAGDDRSHSARSRRQPSGRDARGLRIGLSSLPRRRRWRERSCCGGQRPAAPRRTPRIEPTTTTNLLSVGSRLRVAKLRSRELGCSAARGARRPASGPSRCRVVRANATGSARRRLRRPPLDHRRSGRRHGACRRAGRARRCAACLPSREAGL